MTSPDTDILSKPAALSDRQLSPQRKEINSAPDSEEPSTAAVMLDPSFQAYLAISACRPPENYDIEPAEVFAQLKAIAAAVISGDTRHPETIAVSHATALNVMF